MEENKQQLAALKRLLDLPHNKQCADCVGGGGAARASWASINTGVFICMRCAGIHRGLGVHVSKVRRSHHITEISELSACWHRRASVTISILITGWPADASHTLLWVCLELTPEHQHAPTPSVTMRACQKAQSSSGGWHVHLMPPGLLPAGSSTPRQDAGSILQGMLWSSCLPFAH